MARNTKHKKPNVDILNRKPEIDSHAKLIPFLAMIGRHWPAMALGTLLSLLATLSAIGLLSLSGWFIAATAYAGSNSITAKAFNFFLPSIGVRLFAIARTAGRYGERLISHDATFRILETLRTWCYARLEPLAPAGLTRHHTGDLLTRIITDIDTLDNLYLRVVSPTLVAAAVVALLIGFIGYFNPKIAIFSGCLLVVTGVGIPIAANRAARSTAKQLNIRTAQLRTTLVDGIHGIGTLLASGAANSHMEQIHLQHQALARSQSRMSHVTGRSLALVNLINGLAVTGTLYIGVQAVADGTLSGPYLILIVLAVMAGFEAVYPLSNAYQYLGQTRRAANRLRSITEATPAVIFPATSDQVPADGRIVFDSVSFHYARQTKAVLEEINFTIAPGQKTAIMGATGSGKSTILYLLSRFEDPISGKIQMGRVDLETISEQRLRQSICIVDQKSHIFNGTLRDNLLLADPEANDEILYDALSAVQLSDFVKTLPDKLATWVGNAGRLLSGGQARRLAVARAILSKAPVWALDEPTEGLDTVTADAMMRNLLKYGKDKTIIMVTHRPEAIEQMDRVILLKAGRIKAIASPESLKDRCPLYRRLISTNI